MNKLLISTMLNFIYHDSKDYHIIDSGDLSKGDAHYMGITWNEDSIFISCCQNTKYGFSIFSKDFHKQCFNDELDLHETHQIIYVDDKLYFVNTGLNRIEVLDKQGESEAVSFNESTCDVDHLNGIWFDGEYFYVSEFRHKSEEPSAVRITDKNLSLIKTLEIGLPIHNVYVEYYKLYNLVSRRAGLSITDLATEEQDFVDLPELDGMLVRGLARTKNNWYIGASRWETNRKKRHVGDGIILVLDNNFETVDKIIMPDVGPICGIRVIDELDLAHNGVEF